MIDREKITLIGEFPPILLQLLDEQAKGEFTLSTLKHVLGIDMQKRPSRGLKTLVMVSSGWSMAKQRPWA